ncbi:MAG TPA: hypothetical protein VGG38_03050 [Acidimicrobiales bacterium]
MSSIGMKNERPLRGRQIRSFLVRQCATNQGRGYLYHLVTIDKSQTMLRLDGNPIEKIKLWDLQHMLHRPKLGTR